MMKQKKKAEIVDVKKYVMEVRSKQKRNNLEKENGGKIINHQ